MFSLDYDLIPPWLPRLPITNYTIISLVCALLALFAFQRPAHPLKAPKLLSFSQNYPIVGAVQFFTARFEWYMDSIKATATGNFSFWIGPHFVVGLSGPESRQIFFQNPNLGIEDGYAVLFGGGPRVRSEKAADVSQEPGFMNYFRKRILHLLGREYLHRRLSNFIDDVNKRLDGLDPEGITDPFTSIYEIVFQLTMRMVGCTEIASDPERLKKTLRLLQTIEKSSTPTGIIFPWLPTPAAIKRAVAGARLYRSIKHIVDDRRKTDRREDDALQYLMDMGDDMRLIIQFVVGSVFAGQLNTGINAAYMLAYLGSDRHWYNLARAEIDTALSKYAPDHSVPLTRRFEAIPIEAWESEFPLLESCLKDSIRLQLLGTMYRRNIGSSDVKIGNEVIPSGAYVTYHISDVHQDPSIYTDPMKWDPSRYFPDRAEDQKGNFCFIGWGGGRHPCVGQRFAKLEQFIIVASFLTRFEYDTCDEHGKHLDAVPNPDINAHAATKPVVPIRLRYKSREADK